MQISNVAKIKNSKEELEDYIEEILLKVKHIDIDMNNEGEKTRKLEDSPSASKSIEGIERWNRENWWNRIIKETILWHFGKPKYKGI